MTGEHDWVVSSAVPGMSGMPIAFPALSLHATMSSTLFRNSASPPTMAKSSAHALMMALRVSLGLNLESMKSMTTFRPAIPPFLLVTSAHAFIASTDFWNSPGWIERVHVGDHRQADLGVGDADVVGLGLGALRAGADCADAEQSHDDGQDDRQET